MYLSYYKLNKKPFQMCADPNFLWLGDKYKKALSIFEYGVKANKGFLLLTGDVGTGKTTLINAFVNSLESEVITARVSDPGLTKLGLIKYIAEMFKIDTYFETKSEFQILFTQFLEQAHLDDKQVLLIIDEAQHLTDETLEEIRLLSNIEKQDKKLLNIFLVGQNEFNETLERHNNRAFRQRLAVNYTLYSFEPEETKACIEFRLAIAGSQKEIFTQDAIDAIHAISEGSPRVINMICDHALLCGYSERQETISDKIIRKCSQELHLCRVSEPDQKNRFFGSTDDFLEDSTIPPPTDAAIARASKPLPDLALIPPKKQKRKSRPYRAINTLILITLLLTGVFFLTEERIDSFTLLFANSYETMTTPDLEKNIHLTPSPQRTKETGALELPEGLTNTEKTMSAPASTIGTQQVQSGRATESVEVANMIEPAVQPKIIEKAKKPEHTQAENTAEHELDSPANQYNEQPKVVKRASLAVPTQPPSDVLNFQTLNATVTENNISSAKLEITEHDGLQKNTVMPDTDTPKVILGNNTGELPTTENEETKTESVIIPEHPERTDAKTTSLANNEIINELRTLPPPAAGPPIVGIEAPLTTREITTDPDKHSANLKKEEPVQKDDPGAIIDWLIKSD